MHLHEIKNALDQCGITMLIAAANRNITTLPDGLTQAVTDLNDLAEQHADRYDHIPDMRAQRAVQQQLTRTCQMTVYAKADAIITDHLRPALAQLLTDFRADLKTASQYADRTDPAVEIVNETDDVRHAYLRLQSAGHAYGTLRTLWAAMSERQTHKTIDPQGVHSPLGEVANLPDLVPEWQRAAAGRAPWPWYGTAFHVRMAWLLNHDAHVWLPTGLEQSQAWQQYNPNRRVHAAY